jgi:phosphoribosyl-ATP pyrophosphohydrolase
MKGESKSCFGRVALFVVALALICYAIPGLFKVIVIGSAGLFSVGLVLLLLVFAALGYFTYRNLSGNKAKLEEQKFSKVSRVEQMYSSVQSRLDQSPGANQVLADEFLQAEILVKDKLPEIKTDLIRLKDVTSPKNQKIIEDQLRDYRRQLREGHDPAVRKVIEENIAMVQGNKDRLNGAVEEIREKEASLDLLYHSLVKVDEDLKLGKIVQQIFSPDLYARFGVSLPGRSQEPLPPMPQKSSLTE